MTPPPVETVRLSQKAKDLLVNKVKRATKIKQWNILCRWALLLSLAEPTPPAPADIPLDSNVEMTWRVFGGVHAELLAALVRTRCIHDGLEPDPAAISEQLKLHLHRGIGYLAGSPSLTSIGELTRYCLS